MYGITDTSRFLDWIAEVSMYLAEKQPQLDHFAVCYIFPRTRGCSGKLILNLVPSPFLNAVVLPGLQKINERHTGETGETIIHLKKIVRVELLWSRIPKNAARWVRRMCPKNNESNLGKWPRFSQIMPIPIGAVPIDLYLHSRI